ncbi:MAG: ABC transporter ATP-binding protein, partial [Turicibacter sp.]|nr:ABC transporter ATP-binding protein [Turicibacter sp.]
VIENISFKAKRGETIACIGPTGCGKSTLVNLIPRFYDVTEGEVLVNGVNVKDYDQQVLRNKLGYVSQKAVLFEGTVESNVDFGDNGKACADIHQVMDAVNIAQASEFVENMEGTYEAHIAQGGTNLSGGQKQRLSIARAIARRPEVLIFDDSFSALDYKTDRKLRSVLKKETQGTTLLIVAQRIGTIKDADKIIVLEDGRMVGMGTHDELISNCEVYQEIAYSQLSKEELANE